MNAYCQAPVFNQLAMTGLLCLLSNVLGRSAFRRKRVRCYGEQPKCSFCVRLGQDCRYPDNPPRSKMDQPATSVRENVQAPDFVGFRQGSWSERETYY